MHSASKMILVRKPKLILGDRTCTQPACVRLLSFFKKETKYEDAVSGLKGVYRTKLLPLEEQTFFHALQSPKLYDADFEAKPLVLLMGQYSTGKTTMIRYMLQTDFPGMHIGPEPTTDRFMAIMHGEKEGTIPGNALVVDPSKPFAPLAKYGNAFLTKFQCSLVPSPVLEGVSLIDTPGILSGEKQRVDRGYDFIGALEWFSERVDRIILLFDANKLDISDEFRYAIEALRGNEEKIQIVLNKADSLDPRALVRVYGSLMWSLGKVLKTPEVAKIYIGSFWDKPLIYSDLRKLFEDDERELLKDIQNLPLNSILRKLSDLSKRARLVKVHALIIESLHEKMPTVFGKEAKKNELITNLQDIYDELQTNFSISHGDFPPLAKMQERLRKIDFSRLSSPKKSLIRNVDEMLHKDITALMALLHRNNDDKQNLKDGAFVQMGDTSTPFAYRLGEGFDAGRGEEEWVVEGGRWAADATFEKLSAESGKLGRGVARSQLLKSGLPSGVLGQIYALADVDGDGLLDRDEYALAQYIIQLKLQGFDLPTELPTHLVPPSKR